MGSWYYQILLRMIRRNFWQGNSITIDFLKTYNRSLWSQNIKNLHWKETKINCWTGIRIRSFLALPSLPDLSWQQPLSTHRGQRLQPTINKNFPRPRRSSTLFPFVNLSFLSIKRVWDASCDFLVDRTPSLERNGRSSTWESTVWLWWRTSWRRYSEAWSTWECRSDFSCRCVVFG